MLSLTQITIQIALFLSKECDITTSEIPFIGFDSKRASLTITITRSVNMETIHKLEFRFNCKLVAIIPHSGAHTGICLEFLKESL